MPDLPLIDTHVHLWDPAHLCYPWLAEVPALNRPHRIEDFRRACGSVQIAKLVFVQCECDPSLSWREAQWVAEVAKSEPRLRGIVAQAPLEKGDAVEDDLVRLAEIPLVRGVRRLLQSEADDAFCLRPDFVRGVRRLARFGFSFDLCVFHRQLANATELVRRCPEVRFVLDHIGKPAIKEGRLEPWRTDLKALAALPNVWCKVSGLVTEADWAKWTAADLRPYLEHVRACFGPERLMFGGDWPVSTQATDYPRWVATVDEIWRACPPAELRRLYVANAEQFYRI